MSVDHKGTAPGLANKAEVKPVVISLKCKNDQRICDSMQATEIKVDGAPHVGQRVYRCLECGHAWSVAVGGSFAL